MNIDEILSNASVIAMVGLSGNQERASYEVGKYLMEQGYTVIPINPMYDEVLGKDTYPSVSALPEDINVDVVDIFRDPAHTADVVQDVVEWVEQSGRKPVVWTQYNVSSDEAEELARDHGLEYVKNECMKVEHKRWVRKGEKTE